MSDFYLEAASRFKVGAAPSTKMDSGTLGLIGELVASGFAIGIDPTTGKLAARTADERGILTYTTLEAAAAQLLQPRGWIPRPRQPGGRLANRPKSPQNGPTLPWEA